MMDHRSCTRNLSSCEIKAWLQTWTRDSKPSSLFQALGQWGWSQKRARDERDLVKKIGEGALSYFLGLMHEMHTDPKSGANLVCQCMCHFEDETTRDRSPKYKYAGK